MVDVSGRRSPPRVRAKRAGEVVGIALLAASGILGGNLLGIRDRLLGSGVPLPRAAAVSAFVPVGSSERGQETVLRSQPWWQGVALLQGAGSATPNLSIAVGAIQWRARWSCASGRLVVRLGRRAAPLIDASCPAAGATEATASGRLMLPVEAGGPWKLAVDQQVDVPLIEPPLPTITAPGTATVVIGAFQRIDQFATGRVAVYRLSSGGYAMRFTNFYVTPNVDLEVRLSTLRSPRSTAQYLSAPSAHVAPLNITAGSLNFIVPRGIDLTPYHSVVIWCPLISSAYAQAPLRAVS